MDEALLDAARLIRSELAELLSDEAEHRRMDARLADLLRRAGAGEDVTVELETVLTRHGVVRAWVADVRRDPGRRPPDLQALRAGGYSPLPGDPRVSELDRFTCAAGDLLWFRRHVGQVVPVCPTHRLRLVPVEGPGRDAG